MLTGAIRGQIDALRNALWTGGVANPLTGVEQITYLLFIKRLDGIQTREEARAAELKQPPRWRSIFDSAGSDGDLKPVRERRGAALFEGFSIDDVAWQRS